MNPAFLALEPWCWTPEQVGRVSFVTARRLYHDPARRQWPDAGKAESPAASPAPPVVGWDWSKGPPPKERFVAGLAAAGVPAAEAESTWERLTDGQKADRRG